MGSSAVARQGSVGVEGKSGVSSQHLVQRWGGHRAYEGPGEVSFRSLNYGKWGRGNALPWGLGSDASVGGSVGLFLFCFACESSLLVMGGLDWWGEEVRFENSTRLER